MMVSPRISTSSDEKGISEQYMWLRKKKKKMKREGGRALSLVSSHIENASSKLFNLCCLGNFISSGLHIMESSFTR